MIQRSLSSLRLKIAGIALLSSLMISVRIHGAIGLGDTNAPPACTNGCGSACAPAQQPPKPSQSCGPWMPAGSCGGMPQWWVQEPTINLRLEDEPLGYTPALGPRVSFGLSYRQRGVVPENP